MKKESFRERLKRLMVEKKLTVRSVATRAKVSSSTLQEWRSGANPTDYLAVKRLADLLDVSFEFLLLGNEGSLFNEKPSITECFSDGGVIFDGYAKIVIQRLHPRKDGGSDEF